MARRLRGLSIAARFLSCVGREGLLSPKLPPGKWPKSAIGVHSQVAEEKKAMPTKTVSFSDYQSAFRNKSTREVIRALFVLKLCSYDVFVNNSLKLMTTAQAVLGRKLFDMVIRPTFYDQFVAGDDGDSLKATINRLTVNNVKPMIACMMEDDDIDSNDPLKSENNYNNNLQRILNCIELLGRIGNNPSLQVKITGLMPVSLMVKLNPHCTKSNFLPVIQLLADCMKDGTLQSSQLLGALDEREKIALQNGLTRLQRIGQYSIEKNVTILVDAEYISMQSTLNAMAMAMMRNHNKDRPQVWDTVQCYLKEANHVVQLELKTADELGVCYGLKIVRGAYMDRERQLAAEQHYPDPVNPTYEATGEMYNRVVDIMLNRIKSVGSKCKIVVATHNEDGVRHAMSRIHELNLENRKDLITFGQLYGMCDQVTFPLSEAGWMVYKSIPYGTVSEVLPYLYRRATENRGVLKVSRKEREMLRKELKRRIFSPKS